MLERNGLGNTSDTKLEVRGAGAKRVAVVTLPNGRSISTTIAGNPNWLETLEKNVRKFKDKD